MKILLLGAGGMLGNELATQLADQELVVGDLPDFDITDYPALGAKIKVIKPEIIINATGFTNVDTCETAIGLCNKVNGEAVGNLALLAKENGAIFVHFSSDYVFDGKDKAGYNEASVPKPLNAYGQSKLLGEQLLLQNCTNYYLIRTAWMYGAHGENFVKKIINLAKEQSIIKMVNDQIGNPTYAPDLAIAVKNVIINRLLFGIYHLTNSGSVSWYDFALKIKEYSGFEAKIAPVSSEQFIRPAIRPKNSVLINTKLPPLRSWQNALKEYLSNK